MAQPQAEIRVIPVEIDRGNSLWSDAWHRLRRNRMALAGGILLILLAFACAFGPIFSQSYEEQNLDLGAAPPSRQHWLGTDTLGRDLLARSLYGGRISIMVGLVATFVALTIGVTYGAVAGYVGGKVDAFMMRIVDILYALPFAIFVILLMVFFGRNIFLLFFAIGAVEWLTMARIVRGPGDVAQAHGVHRGGARPGPRAPADHLPPRDPQRPRARDRLHDPHDTRGHAARVLPELPRPRRAGAR